MEVAKRSNRVILKRVGTQARQAREAQASISSADSYLECLLAGGRMDWLNTGWGTALPLLPCPSCATGSRGLVVGFYRGTRARPVCQDLRACWPAYLAARCAPGHARVYQVVHFMHCEQRRPNHVGGPALCTRGRLLGQPSLARCPVARCCQSQHYSTLATALPRVSTVHARRKLFSKPGHSKHNPRPADNPSGTPAPTGCRRELHGRTCCTIEVHRGPHACRRTTM